MRTTLTLFALVGSACSVFAGEPSHVGEEVASDDPTSSDEVTNVDAGDDNADPEPNTDTTDPTTEPSQTDTEPEPPAPTTDPSETSDSEPPEPEPDAGPGSTEPTTEEPDETTTDPTGDEPTSEAPTSSQEEVPPEPPPEGSIPLLLGVATGFETMLSCDDGQTWKNGRATPDGMCLDDGDCSHDPGRAMGLAFSNGWFIVPYGNDPEHEMQVRRTQDGVNWEKVLDRGANGAAAGNGRVVIGGNPPTYSDDDGSTWQDGDRFETVPPIQNSRRVFFIPYDGGRFLIYFESGGMVDLVISPDGKTFHSSGVYPQECWMTDLTYGDGVLLVTNHTYNNMLGRAICRSDDGGETWTVQHLTAPGEPEPTSITSLIWTGEEFLGYGSTTFGSPDAIDWSPVTVTGGANLLQTAHIRTASGVFVAQAGGNQNRIVASPDAKNWMAMSDWTGYIDYFAEGYGPSNACD